MSQAYYNQLLKTTHLDLQNAIGNDKRLKKKPPTDPNQAKWLISHLFVKYIRIVNNLDECYDQIIHPQKREIIGRLLDTSLGRLLEIKREIVRIELDDYIFLDDILLELKMTHQDIEVRIPQNFWREREKAKEHRRKLIQQVFDDIKMEGFKEEFLKNVPEEEKEEKWNKYQEAKEAERIEKEKQEEFQRKRLELAGAIIEEPKEEIKEDVGFMPIGDAILIIQRHERARQDRRNIVMVKIMKKLKETGIKPEKVPEDLANEKAKIIQRHWKNYKRRVKSAKQDEKELYLLGIIEPSYKDKSVFKKVEESLKGTRKIQEKRQEEYEKAIVKLREKLAKKLTVVMREDLKDEIRSWFQWFYQESEYLPDYPSPEAIIPTGQLYGFPEGLSSEFIRKISPPPKNMEAPTGLAAKLIGLMPLQGSALVTAGHWIGPKEFLQCIMELERMEKSGKGGKKDEKGKRNDRDEDGERKKKKKKDGDAIVKNKFLEPLIKADKEYEIIWSNLDESNNYEQRHVNEFIKEEECFHLSMKIRKLIDELMKVELDVLKNALAKDLARKEKEKAKGKKAAGQSSKPSKSKKGKGKKEKEGKKGKGKKSGKEENDQFSDKTDDELFMELFRNGVIREYDEAHLKDYIGERSYTAYESRKMGENPLPCTGDVKDLLLQLCILPLGSNRVHQLSSVIKSVCLLGPENTGKEFLARIVCTETASVMFDITPSNLQGKYKGKKGMKNLQGLIEKMSRKLQPSVIFIDGAEKPFYKTVPKQEKQTDPKRVGKFLPKFVKSIKPGEQILVLGVCSNPGLAQPRPLLKTFDKFIFVPKPEYGTYLHLWQRLLIPYHSLPRSFDFSALARLSKDYSAKAIIDVVQKVLNPERICRNRMKPYKVEDFIEELLNLEPIGNEKQKQCWDFYMKTPLAKKRVKRLKELKAEKEKAEKEAMQKGGKKKK